MNKKIYIATVAEKGAGKGLFVLILKKIMPERRIASVRFSDMWREMLHILGKEESRDNISTIATAIRIAFHNDGILIGAMRNRLQMIDADIIVLDGLRKSEETELIREVNGVLLYISADEKVRFERRRQHAETTDEKGMDWEQFMRQEQAETEVSIRSIGENMADARIENNGTAEEFEQKINVFLKEHGIGR